MLTDLLGHLQKRHMNHMVDYHHHQPGGMDSKLPLWMYEFSSSFSKILLPLGNCQFGQQDCLHLMKLLS